MIEEVKVPTVGESIAEVTVAAWLKKDGDTVKLDEVIAEMESDKATFELAATAAGTLRIVAAEGENVPIGGLLCTIDTEANGQPASPAPATASTPAPAPELDLKGNEQASPTLASQVLEMKVPVVGESIAEVTIATWHKKTGDTVKQDEVLAEIESDKATFELAAEASGVLTIVAEAGSTLPIGAVVCRIAVGASAPASAPAAAPAAQPQPASPAAAGASVGAISPVAAAILAEKGINPSAIKGTGPGGKITKDDAVRAEKAAAAPAPSPAPVKPSLPADARGQKRQKMSNLRKTIARRLVAVKNETAMLTTFNEVDMKPVMDLRSRYKDKFKEKHGVGLGFMSFFSRACAIALQEWPAVNGMIDGDEIVHNDFVDISIAVSTPKGLVVPVIRNVETLSLAEIEKEVLRLAGLARDGKLSIEQMTGGTFTITNGGVFGSMMSTPIINAPQSAILGMHNIVERPMVVNGEIVIRPIMYVALSYDHRIIDGRESVSFLVRVKQLLEDPARMLLDV